jgi:putative thioredoxin
LKRWNVASSQWVVDVTDETFQNQVIAQSHQRPVVVDFWAPWCAPCRALGPKLEALAAERNGGFLLAKVNTDENQQLAQAFQVDGIPAVYGIRNGKLIDQFTGVLPYEELQAFIDRLIPSEEEQKAAHALELEGRDPKAAAELYRELLTANPENPAAHIGLARLLLAVPGNESEARNLLTGTSFDDYATEAARLRTILQLRDAPHSEAELLANHKALAAQPNDAAVHYSLSVILAARGEYTPALDALLAAAENDRILGREKVRELMLKIFAVIGPRSPEADQYRKRLQLLLY